MFHRCRTARWAIVSLAALLGGTTLMALAGDPVPPPGPVGPTMKTLDQIEARTPVDSLPGSATALFIISAPGSYYLTGNLVGVDGKHGIEISSGGVSLDLNGFTLSGSPASLSGVFVTSPGSDSFGNIIRRNGISIANGGASGWGDSGFDAWFAAGSSLRNLRASLNGVDGLRLGDGGCRESQAVENGDDGFEGFQAIVISEFEAFANGGRGLRAGAGSKVVDCVSRINGGVGISLGEAALVQGCVVTGNGTDGILLSRLVYALNNYCDGNGVSGVGDGIRATSNGCRIEGNAVSLNRHGISTDAGFNLIICNSSRNNLTSDFNIMGANNTVGPILTSGNITSTNPWANFAF